MQNRFFNKKLEEYQQKYPKSMKYEPYPVTELKEDVNVPDEFKNIDISITTGRSGQPLIPIMCQKLAWKVDENNDNDDNKNNDDKNKKKKENTPARIRRKKMDKIRLISEEQAADNEWLKENQDKIHYVDVMFVVRGDKIQYNMGLLAPRILRALKITKPKLTDLVSSTRFTQQTLSGKFVVTVLNEWETEFKTWKKNGDNVVWTPKLPGIFTYFIYTFICHLYVIYMSFICFLYVFYMSFI